MELLLSRANSVSKGALALVEGCCVTDLNHKFDGTFSTGALFLICNYSLSIILKQVLFSGIRYSVGMRISYFFF